MFALANPRRLRERGIVGMNGRNISLLAALNPRHLYPRVDNKLNTKILAREAGIAVPGLIGVARYQHHVKGLAEFLADHHSFVIKPAKGSGGKGILVIMGHDGDDYLKPSGDSIPFAEISRHASNILSGLYSLGGLPDVAMIEELVKFSDVFSRFSHQGVPDVRVIVYRGYPVMAMMRLSTAESDGKANLHQGAVGVGIDIGNGHAVRAVQHDRPVTHHPDTSALLDELQVPDWEQVLALATRCYEVTDLGYLGADIVLDKEDGPLVLELNARPGLAIQVANGEGLQGRTDAVDRRIAESHGREDPEQRAAFSRAEFGRVQKT
jgi:alpha-L-glutamate ligase-like protein